MRHPSKIVNVGDDVEVIVLDVNRGAKRISLGMKQVEPDPWTMIEERYTPGTVVAGRVRNLTDFGAFIELESGVDGLLHISDMSWTRNVAHPSEVLKKGQDLETVILSIDRENKRISLGFKQLQPDPWTTVAQRYPMGARVTGKVVREGPVRFCAAASLPVLAATLYLTFSRGAVLACFHGHAAGFHLPCRNPPGYRPEFLHRVLDGHRI